MADVWAMKKHNELYNEEKHLQEYEGELYGYLTDKLAIRKQCTDVYNIEGKINWKEVKDYIG